MHEHNILPEAFLYIGNTIYHIQKNLNPKIEIFTRATDGVRTRDPDLGKVVLYQLSHCRIHYIVPFVSCVPWNNTYYTG